MKTVNNNELNKNLTAAQTLFNKLLSNKYICIFPMGEVGINVYFALQEIGIKVNYFIDNNPEKHETMLGNAVCISIESFKDIAEDAFVLIASGSYNELNEIAINAGAIDICAISHIKLQYINKFTSEYLNEYKAKLNEIKTLFCDDFSIKIIDKLYDIVHNYNYLKVGYNGIVTYPQYFDRKIFHFSNDEIFIDAGAFTGDTILSFIDCVQGNYQKIYAFEIDSDVFKKLHHKVMGLTTNKKIDIFNAGLSNENGISFIYKGVISNSRLSDEGEKIELIALDSLIKHDQVSFIKMDIEGSELAALQGASKIIKAFQPKLAICVYHHPEDLYKIPNYIKNLVPEYKLYLRHHTNVEYETVLYATL